MSKRTAPPFAGASRPVSPLAVWLGVGILLVLVIGITRLFGPEKPITPQSSQVRYTPYEQPTLNPVDLGPPGSGSSASNRHRQEAEGKRIAAKESDPITLVGTVTDADTGETLAPTVVRVNRALDENDNRVLHEAQKAALQEESSSSGPGAEDGPARKHFFELQEDLNSERETVTDRNGEYRVGLPCPGSYVAYAHHDGYILVGAKMVRVDEGETEARLDIRLKRGATISGRVTERGTGKGAVGIRVGAYADPSPGTSRRNIHFGPAITALSGAGMEFPDETDAKGNFKLIGLPAGEFTVALQIGDALYRFAGLPPARVVNVSREGEDIHNVNFVVEPAGLVWGYVLDETGEPVKGAEVIQCFSDSIIAQVAEAATHLRPPIRDSTDEQGLYRLFGPPLNRECRVFVMAGKYSPQISGPFVLTATNREARVDIFLTPGSTVYGRVLNRSNNRPVGVAEVQCIPAVSRLLSPFDAAVGFRDARTDKNGEFKIEHLPVGEHKLFAQARKYKFSLAGEPVFCDGYSDYQVDLFLEPVDVGEHTVFGVVKDSSGRPVEGAHLSLVAFSLENLQGAVGGREATSDAKGNYMFTGVEAGSPMLVVEAKGYNAARLDKVELDAPTDVELTPAARVSGRVVIRETGQPPVACSVRAHPTSTPAGDLLSSLESLQGYVAQCTNGEFSLELPEGEYMLVANPQGASPGRIQVDVGAGEQIDGLVIEVGEQGGSIAGRVLMRNGQSPAGATVMLGQEGASYSGLVPLMEDLQVRSVQVGEDGAFEFKQLAGGAYRLTARLEGYADGHSNPVVLRDGQALGGVEIVLGSGGRLQGTVIIGGEAAPGAIVTISGMGFNQVVTADRNGQYLIENIPPGQYLAAAMAPDLIASGRFAPSHGQVMIVEDQTTQYNFGDAQGATVEGLCTPPQPLGQMGFAILRIAGTGEDISQLDFRSLASMFTGDMSSVPSLVGLAQIDRDGWFQIENAPEGSYSLDVYYLTLGNLMTSQGRRVYSTMVDITGKDPISLQIAVAQ